MVEAVPGNNRSQFMKARVVTISLNGLVTLIRTLLSRQ
jgi:hypothetical protein